MPILTALTHGNHAEARAAAPPRQLVQQRGGAARARGAQRVAQRDGAAVGVHLQGVKQNQRMDLIQELGKSTQYPILLILQILLLLITLRLILPSTQYPDDMHDIIQDDIQS
jgi:hypothetical protein